MNKTELIEIVSKNAELTKKESAAAVDALLDGIVEGLVKDGKVQLIGFGTFEVRSRKARTGRNPRKPGEVIKIPASKAPVFKAGKALKDAVN